MEKDNTTLMDPRTRDASGCASGCASCCASGGYLRRLKRLAPCLSFRVDGFYSWMLAAASFSLLVVSTGIGHSLGVFFPQWMIRYNATESTLIWVQSASSCSNLLSAPIVILLSKVVPGQLLLMLASVSNCAAYLCSAFFGKVYVLKFMLLID